MRLQHCLTLIGIVALLGVALVGCAPPAAPTEVPPAPPPTPTEAAPPPPPPPTEELADTLYVYNWADYIDESLLTDYEEEFGVTVVYDTFDSNEDLLAKLQAGATGYNVIFPSDYMVAQMIELGMLAELDFDNIPNFANLYDENIDPAYDPGNVYSVPYYWGTTGIGYHADFVDPPPDSWAWLFDPDIACQYADGGINMLDDQREVIGAALRYLGYSINETDEAPLMEARDLLLAAKPCYKTFDSSGYIDNLMIPGEVVLAHAWNGDVFVAAEENEGWTYVMPKEGGVIWQDNMCVTATTTGLEKRTAEHFINYLLDAEVAGQNTNYIWYPSPNKAAEPYIDPEILEDPSIYPDEETRANLEWIAPFTTEELAIWDRVWTEFKVE
ncbi:MAG: extracellular solute-binding protein [Anaerolineae bacterium]|nr:extracellular solute-binding protein [Anaerolineae bacterium]NIN94769.1 extracellular solute-binding protein [Anaerolineae bacterium]NIQ77851.1 extracellular solute-binding protein [Anaerolineae bacterium]